MPSLTIPYTTSTNPVLVKGSGFSGATAQPSAVGNSGAAGYSENAIARWNCVPYQTFTGTMRVGVVAFHIEGILGVSFSVNGGNWFFVKTPSLNPDTNTTEYWSQLHASDFSDGQIEVRAVVYPVSGVPRVLQGATIGADGVHSMWLNANSGGSLNPTIRYISPSGNDANDGLTSGAPKKDPALAIHSANSSGNVDGVTIYMLAGTHTWTSASFPNNQDVNPNRWAVLMPAPGVTRSQVHLQMAGVTNAANGGSLNLVRLYNLTIDAGGGLAANSHGNAFPYMTGSTQILWWDNCAVDGTLGGGRYDTRAEEPMTAPGSSIAYATDCTVSNVQGGAKNNALVRNCTVDTIEEDAFSYSHCIINSTATNMDPGSSGAHPDVSMQLTSSTNTIYSGVTNPSPLNQANSQGFTYSSGNDNLSVHRDHAAVNCSLSTGGNIEGVLILDGTIRNMLFKNTTFRGQCRSSPDAGNGGVYNATKLYFQGCIFQDYTTGNVVANPSIEFAVFQ